MIRKAVILVLLLAALAVNSLYLVYYFVTPPMAFYFEDSIHVYHLGRRVVYVHVQHGVGGQASDPRYVIQVEFPWWFRITRYKHPAGFTRWNATVYVRPTFAVLVAYPTVAFIRGPFRRWRRRRKGLCLKCGYDLTGNESGACSECGEEVES